MRLFYKSKTAAELFKTSPAMQDNVSVERSKSGVTKQFERFNNKKVAMEAINITIESLKQVEKIKSRS